MHQHHNLYSVTFVVVYKLITVKIRYFCGFTMAILFRVPKYLLSFLNSPLLDYSRNSTFRFVVYVKRNDPDYAGLLEFPICFPQTGLNYQPTVRWYLRFPFIHSPFCVVQIFYQQLRAIFDFSWFEILSLVGCLFVCPRVDDLRLGLEATTKKRK